MKLFAIYIGGEHPKANIEVHDVRFVVADAIEDTYARLRADWWGKHGTLHVDCWAEIVHTDGYDVFLKPDVPAGPEQLYFVNLGGCDGQEFAERHKQEFAERHKNVFVVATSITEAKKSALRSVTGWRDAHKDDIYEAEQAFALDEMVSDGLRIHLVPAVASRDIEFVCRYTPLK